MTLPRKNIVLIDDDPITNLINKRIIENYFGFKTIVFTNAAEALGQLKQWLMAETNMLPEIIFLDIDMPDMNGWEFLDELHTLPDALIDKCHIIVLTSSIDFEDIEKSKTYRVVRGFISKPLTADSLRMLVNG
jgi:CheY-like chemotaxis protein